MADTALIVCERSGRWGAALRRELGSLAGTLRETRTLEECRCELQVRLAPWVVLELRSENAEDVARWLIAEQRRHSATRFCVAGERALAACETILRDCGAAYFVTSPRDLEPFVAAVRNLQTSPTGLGRSWSDGVLAALPWQ